MVGQWVSVITAEIVAAACAAIGVGIVIGLAVAGERGGRRRTAPGPLETSTSAANPSGPPAVTVPADAGGTAFPRATDLRGALLANTTLVRADLRYADMRGATLRGADLSGADLTQARLGPLEEGAENDDPA
jgi:Pentapeptide repeats (8 copies)